MTQWFRGELEGHYVGTGVGTPAVSQYGSADRYKLRIYRALIRKIEVLESKGDGPKKDAAKLTDGGTAREVSTARDESTTARDEGAARDETPPEPPPEIPIELPEECFYQAKIEDTRLIGIRPRTCFEGTIYDVAVSGLRVTHSTKEGEKTYGRVVGEIYGRYLLPPEADPEAEAEIAAELTATTELHEPGSEEAIAALGAQRAAEEAAEEEAELDALHPPSDPEEGEASAVATHVPVPLLAVVVAVLLGLLGGWQPVLIWLAFLVPILAVRFMLGDQFKVTTGQRVFGAILVLIQMGCVGVILLDWWAASCITLNPWAVGGVGLTALIASVLPSAFPMLLTGAGMASVLVLWSGDIGTTCESLEAKPKVERPIERPTVDDPGVPRTNSDGSWPRRGPRKPKPVSKP